MLNIVKPPHAREAGVVDDVGLDGSGQLRPQIDEQQVRPIFCTFSAGSRKTSRSDMLNQRVS